MWFLKFLIALPLLGFFIVFLVQNNEIVSLWPFTDMEWFGVERVGTSIVYFVLFCLGYFCGRLSAWSAYAPLRALLRQQKKENKVLSKEHAKLNHEHEILNQQVSSLQEAERQAKAARPSFGNKIKRWFSSVPDNKE
jgi:cell division protein FtsB